MGIYRGTARPHPAHSQQQPDELLAGPVLAQVVHGAAEQVTLTGR